MDTLEEALLAANLNDADELDYLIIDNDFRTISIPKNKSILGVFNDKDVNRIWFKCPRYYGDIDLSEYFFRINYLNARGYGDIYQINDLVANENYITFSWVVGSTAFLAKGNIVFNVCARKFDTSVEPNIIKNEFNTTVHYLQVLEGLEIDNAYIEEHYPDFIDQIMIYSNSASQSASSAETSADAASDSEANALSYKNAAAASEANALAYKNDAASSAAAAEASAQSLNADVLNSSILASFLKKKRTGNFITIEDGAENALIKKLNISFKHPLQDLHGYDAPWPGGGGKNKWGAGETFEKDNSSTYVFKEVSLSAGTYTISGLFTTTNPNNRVRFSFRTTTPVTVDLDANGGNRTYGTFTLSEDCTSVRVYGQASTADSYAATFTNVQVEAGSTATDFAPYSNICPISGFTGLTLTRTGKNLLDNSALVHGGLNGNTGASDTTDQRILTDYLFFKAGTYTVSCTSDSIITRVVLCVYDLNENYLIDESHAVSWNALNLTFTLTADRLVRFAFAMATNDTINLDAAKGTLQIELGSTATAYAPYQGSTYPVSWQTEAGTVYEGTLNVLSGLLTATHTSITLNGSETWGATNNSTFYVQVNGLKKLRNYVGAIICDKLKTYAAHDNQGFVDAENGITGYYDYASAYSSQNWIYAKSDGITTAADFKTWLASNPLQLVYELAAPVTYQLTPQQVTTLLGLNNIWTDVGTMDLEYCQDPKVLESQVLVSFPSDTATGVIASFSDGADGIPMKSVLCAINPVQSGSGPPSPDNVRPISGFTGLTLSHSGADTSDPTTLAVSWQSSAGTVYGGTLDVVSGLLTVTMASVDLGTLDWLAATTSTANVYRMRSTGINASVRRPVGSTDAAVVICSSFKTVAASETYRLTQGVAVDVNGNIQVYDEEYNTASDAAAFKTAMSGVQLVYELATPQTYQLTPTKVDSLLGANNLWHDANGNITVNYRADTKLYIDKKISQI